MSELILRKSYRAIGKTMIKYAMGKMISYAMRTHDFYKSLHNPNYDFSGSRQSASKIPELNRYVAEVGVLYRDELNTLSQSGDMEETSEYYLYKYIESHDSKEDLTICNIGAFYCGADVHFLKKHPKATVYGLDFGDLHNLNQDILIDRLKLFSGYPLETLEKFAAEGKKQIFDYVIFSRTAALINPNELFSYMEIISQLAKNVCFLEVAKTTSLLTPALDVEKIKLEKPVKVFNMVRIHNYIALLKKYNFKILDSAVLPPTAFKQYFVPDHQFIFAAGQNQRTTN